MADSFVRPSRVALTAAASGKTMTISIETMVGKGVLRPLGDPDYIYASEPQFHILRDPASGEWVVVHDGAAKNPTCVNGKALSAKSPLKNGDYVSVGPTKLRLNVAIELV